MKTYILSLVLAIATFSISSCVKHDDIFNNNTGTPSGTWRVTLFTDSGNDETSDFAGYIFTFNDGGALTAVKNGVTQNGVWNINSSSNKFIIDLGPKSNSNKPLGELTDDWKILSRTDTRIQLGDDNSSSNEFLTFTKN